MSQPMGLTNVLCEIVCELHFNTMDMFTLTVIVYDFNINAVTTRHNMMAEDMELCYGNGYLLLRKLGWIQGTSLGKSSNCILKTINIQVKPRFQNC